MLARVIYVLVVSGVTGLAAAAADRLLRLYDLPARGVWAGALACETSPPDPGSEAEVAAERAPTDPPASTPEPEAIPYDGQPTAVWVQQRIQFLVK